MTDQANTHGSRRLSLRLTRGITPARKRDKTSRSVSSGAGSSGERSRNRAGRSVGARRSATIPDGGVREIGIGLDHEAQTGALPAGTQTRNSADVPDPPVGDPEGDDFKDVRVAAPACRLLDEDLRPNDGGTPPPHKARNRRATQLRAREQRTTTRSRSTTRSEVNRATGRRSGSRPGSPRNG